MVFCFSQVALPASTTTSIDTHLEDPGISRGNGKKQVWQSMHSYSMLESQICVLTQPPDLPKSEILPLLSSQNTSGEWKVLFQCRRGPFLSSQEPPQKFKTCSCPALLGNTHPNHAMTHEVGQICPLGMIYVSILATGYKGYLFWAHQQAEHMEKLQQFRGRRIFWEQ